MELHEFLRPYKKAALIYRGGLCSAYLLYAAAACRVHIVAYMVENQEPLKYAVSIAKALGAEARPLAREPGEDEPALLCRIRDTALRDGYDVLFDAACADLAEDDPEIRLLEELGVLMPFRACGLDENEVKRRAENAGFRLG